MANEFVVKNGLIVNSGGISTTVDLAITGSLNVSENIVVQGTITAQEYNTEFVSSSIIFESGSTQFGNSVDDTHIFTGSVSISGSITADVFTARNGTGTPTLIGDSGIILSSSNHVQIKGASLRMHLFSSESLGSHVSTDGDVIYNTTENT